MTTDHGPSTGTFIRNGSSAALSPSADGMRTRGHLVQWNRPPAVRTSSDVDATTDVSSLTLGPGTATSSSAFSTVSETTDSAATIEPYVVRRHLATIGGWDGYLGEYSRSW